MMTVAVLPPVIRAHKYLSESDHPGYYHQEESAPSEFIGSLAEKLGIAGEVVTEGKFNRYLQGEVAGKKVGTFRDSKWHHKPGYDCVFSPDKSISVMAHVGGDGRLLDAHDEAVKEAFDYLESEVARFRKHLVDENGKSTFEHISTKNLMAGMFRHDCNRNMSPHVHSHVAIFNLTNVEFDDFRSIEGRHLYHAQKKAGRIYQQSLASKVKNLGYDIEHNDEGYFRIASVPKEVSNEFSDRTKDIDEALKKRGLTRKTASAAEKQALAYATRDKKIHVDNNILRQVWLEKTEQLGFDAIALKNQAYERSQDVGWEENQRIDDFEKSRSLLISAVNSISERKAVFTKNELIDYVSDSAVAIGISRASIIHQFDLFSQSGELLPSQDVKTYSIHDDGWVTKPGFTTPNQIYREQSMLDILHDSVNKFEKVFSPEDIDQILQKAVDLSKKAGFDGWTPGQLDAANLILSSRNQFIGINGLAGSAKTTTVLKTVASEYTKLGYEVIGMAPSSSACYSLSEGADIYDDRTVAAHLLMHSETYKQKVWLLDEASLLSSKDMLSLMKKARVENARLVIVGDRDQLDAVEAGSAFLQLQENGLKTAEMRDIVRQENELLLESLYDSIEGKVSNAINNLEMGGGRILEASTDSVSRYRMMVNEYMSLTELERENTLLLEPSRSGRAEVNNLVREALIECGSLSSEGLSVNSLKSVDLTREESKHAINYSAGDIVKFGREYKSCSIDKNSYWTILSVDKASNVAVIVDSSGREVIWNPSVWGAKSQVFSSSLLRLNAGEQIIWTKNDRVIGLKNGDALKVLSVDQEADVVIAIRTDGKVFSINLSEYSSQHWDYHYASTVHSAQGQTVDRIIYHAESFRKNLTSQKALYVALSRAKKEAVIVTDSRERLVEQVQEHSGQKQHALTGYDRDFELDI